jgi:predicted metalloprotease with PDZ domain
MLRRIWFVGLLAGFALLQSSHALAASPGLIELDVDASEVARRIIHAHLVIPAKPGPMILVYPKWIPGEHGPTGPITDLAGLNVTAGGREIAWHRDETDMYAISCQVPAGVAAVKVSLDFLSAPPAEEGFTSAASATAQLAIINWNQLLIYPKGEKAGEILFRVSLSLPEGWRFGTALPVESKSGIKTRFSAVSLETLIDSPLLCGKYFREVDLTAPGGAQHSLLMAADNEAALELSPELKTGYSNLVAEAGALFGARHYGSYKFLLSLSDYIAHFGLEHHQSSDNRVPERTLIDEKLHLVKASLMPHEFVHSWNGKYRRPADMATADYQQPKRTSLLWVYEGLTTHLGYVLTARSGLWTPEQYRQALAFFADWVQNQRGRTWRPLNDTAVSAQLLFGARADWQAWRRTVDFYREGVLLWLEMDMIIRQETDSRRSLDDFCRAFFGGKNSPPGVLPYTFEDIVASLNAVASYDWESYLAERLTQATTNAPLGGIESSGWRLTYADTRSEYQEALESSQKQAYLTSSIGMLVKEDGTIVDIVPGKAVDRAGIGPGMKVVAVNSQRWSLDLIRYAIAATGHGSRPLELLLENSGYFFTRTLDYKERAKYPRLERDSSKADLLTKVIEPLTWDRSGQ